MRVDAGHIVFLVLVLAGVVTLLGGVKFGDPPAAKKGRRADD